MRKKKEKHPVTDRVVAKLGISPIISQLGDQGPHQERAELCHVARKRLVPLLAVQTRTSPSPSLKKTQSTLSSACLRRHQDPAVCGDMGGELCAETDCSLLTGTPPPRWSPCKWSDLSSIGRDVPSITIANAARSKQLFHDS